ncbi:MAG TPA: DedA family protein [Roseiflexaceae bacterium]|nr:DedA family protein [Roseiflexaceae bacterium]
MIGLLDKHSLIAILIAVFLEELGLPMPIPTDLLIVFAGVKVAGAAGAFVRWFLLLNVASAAGASGLYLIVRRGGRPLIERYGRYVHLGPRQIERAERLLGRGGWWSIAIGRAIPGLRYLTVIACGLFKVPFLRFVTAHTLGSSVYIAVFLALGSFFGPKVAEYLHLPELQLRLIWMLALALGLPLLLAWLCYRGHAEYTAAPSRRRTFWALVLASFAGATAMAAAWAGAATIAELAGAPRPLNVTYQLALALLGRGLRPASAYMLVYTTLLLLCVGVGVLYYDVVLPLISPKGTTLPRQTLGLALLALTLVCAFLAPALVWGRGRPLDHWWQAGGPLLVLALLSGIVLYALTTACARALAIAILPSFRRTEPIRIVAEPEPTATSAAIQQSEAD